MSQSGPSVVFKPVVIVLVAAGVLLLAALVAVALRGRSPAPISSESAAVPAVAPPSQSPGSPVVRAPAPSPASAPAVAAPKPRAAARGDAGPPEDEAALLARVAELASSDLEKSLQLAREGVARHPDSPNAPELYSDIAKDLVHLGRLEEARDVARLMLKKYPNNPFTLDVERHVLNHPPNPRDVSDAR